MKPNSRRARGQWPVGAVAPLKSPYHDADVTAHFSSCNSFFIFSSSSSLRLLLVLLTFLACCFPSAVNGQAHFFFKVKPKNHDVEEGKSVRLRCVVNNNRNIRYHWTLNNELLEMDTRRLQDNSDLFIRKADPDLDRGNFRCVATNRTTGYSQQTNKASINIFWLQPAVTASLTAPSRVEDISVGGSLELHCKTRASPAVSPTQIFWYYNFQKLKPRIAQQVGVQLQPNGNLLIAKIRHGNVGIYRCQVMHPAGHVMTTRPFPLIFNVNNTKYNASVKPQHFIKYVRKGDPLRLECPYNFTQMQFMQWLFKPNIDDPKTETFMSSRECDSSARFCVLSKSERFAFYRRRVRKRGDVGFYQCNPFPSSQGKPYVIEVRLAYNPRLTNANLHPNSMPDRPVVVVRGKGLTIRVYQDLTPDHRQSIVPDPPPKYSWYMPDGQAEVPDFTEDDRQRIYKANRRNLHIKNARETDSGVYSLVTSNLAGKQRINVTVVVAFQPKFSLTPMSDVRAHEHKRVLLRCNVESKSVYPVARVLWYKNRDRIPQSLRLEEDQRKGTLEIKKVLISDGESYQCAIQTLYIEPKILFSEPFQLRVIKSLKIVNIIPKKFLERNSNARIRCIAEGDDPPKVRWWRGQRQVSERRNGDNPWDNGGVLIFPKVKNKHAGGFTCVASNRQGIVNSTTEIIVGVRPYINSISKNLTVLEGKQVMLNCRAGGDPPPTISWIKKTGGEGNDRAESITKDLYGSNSINKRRVMLTNGSLLIRRALLSDASYYWCVAGNTYAMNSEREVYLKVVASSGAWDENKRESSWSMTKTIIIVVGCAVAYLALIIGLTIYCSLRMLRNRQKRAAWAMAKMEGGAGGASHENGRLIPLPNGESQGLMAPDRSHDGAPGPGDSRSHFSGLSGTASGYTRSLRAGTPSGSLQDRVSTYPRHQLQTLGMLGKGEFGDVFLARAHNIREGEAESLVVIKAHHGGRSEALDVEFHSQMDLFGKLDHDFIVKLLGVCREMEPEFMILEYCEWGDLKQFLKAMRQSDKDNERNVKIPPLTLSQKVTMCSQVALGMEHLSNYRYIHKDLAARNVLLTSTLDLKIANLGLCQDVYAGEYFPMRNKRLPLRWLPPEVILEDAYSTKSDVWAFGVLVGEVFTLGDIPHRRLTDLQVIGAAETHQLSPELPPQCPNELASLLRQCWADKPRERPSFNDISVIIGELTVDSDM